MIIKGESRGVAAEVASHLRKTHENERVVEQAPRGTVAQDLLGALREMEAMAAGSRCKKPLYHAKINPGPGEEMSPERWERAVEALEQKLGLENHARVVVMHLKKGREHAHVVWGRIDPDTLRAWHDGHNFTKHEECARELEREFGHQRVQGAHVDREGERPARTLRDAVTQQASRVGADAREVQAKLVDAWQRSDTGQAFAQAVDDAGYILARGDRRAFVVVYPGSKMPGYVALGARVLGVPAAVVRERLADIDPAALPSMDAATKAMRERAAGIEAAPAYDREAEAARRIGRELDGADEAGRLKATSEARSERETRRRERAELWRDERRAAWTAVQPETPEHRARRERETAWLVKQKHHHLRVQETLDALDGPGFWEAKERNCVTFARDETHATYAVTSQVAVPLNATQRAALLERVNEAMAHSAACQGEVHEWLDGVPLPTLKEAHRNAGRMEREAAREAECSAVVADALAKSVAAGDGGVAFVNRLAMDEYEVWRDYGGRLYLHRDGFNRPMNQSIEERVQHRALGELFKDRHMRRFCSREDSSDAFERRRREWEARKDRKAVRDALYTAKRPVSAIAGRAVKAVRTVVGTLDLLTRVFTELVTDLGNHAEAPPIPPEATDPKIAQDGSGPQDRAGNTLTRLEADDVQARAVLQTDPLSLAHDLAERMRRAEAEARQARERARAAGRGRGGRDDDGRER